MSIKKLSLSILMSVFLFICPALSMAGEIVDRIVAVVNEEIITEADLNRLMIPLEAQYRTRYKAAELNQRLSEARRDFLNQLIEDKIIVSEAKRREVIVSEDEVNARLDEIKEKFPSPEEFKVMLTDQGLTEKKLADRIRDQLMSRKLVDYEVRSRVSASPGEISEYYRSHPDEFQQKEKVKLNHILIRVSPRSDEEAKTLSMTLYQKAKNGELFTQLAQDYSEGSEAKDSGVMGWVERGQLIGEMDQEVFRLNAGDITQPIQSRLGYHIFQVVEKQMSTLKSLDEVRSEIESRLIRQKVRERLMDWLKELKAKSYITIS